MLCKCLQLRGVIAQVADIECFVTKRYLATAAVRNEVHGIVTATAFEVFSDLPGAVSAGVEQQEFAASRAGLCKLLPVGHGFVDHHQRMRRTCIVSV